MSETIGERFMRETRYGREPEGPSDQERGLPQPPLQVPWDPSAVTLDLQAPESLQVPAMDLRAAIEHRRSVRAYADEPMTLEELTWLLWASQGVQRRLEARTLRTVPSGGARHPFETYLVANKVTGVAPGIWRYLALEHKLAAVDLNRPDAAGEAARLCLDQTFLAGAAALFVWTCVPYRVTWRYGQRGYRDMHLDAGHACQNLYLAAEPIGCGVCGILAFDDKGLSEFLGSDGEKQWPIYVAGVGKRQ